MENNTPLLAVQHQFYLYLFNPITVYYLQLVYSTKIHEIQRQRGLSSTSFAKYWEMTTQRPIGFRSS